MQGAHAFFIGFSQVQIQVTDSFQKLFINRFIVGVSQVMQGLKTAKFHGKVNLNSQYFHVCQWC